MEAVNGLMTYCRVTGKVCYTSKIKALLALVKIEEVGPKEEGGLIPKRVYRCEFCGDFHLTQQDERTPQLISQEDSHVSAKRRY